jgi:hypothetical protein
LAAGAGRVVLDHLVDHFLAATGAPERHLCRGAETTSPRGVVIAADTVGLRALGSLLRLAIPIPIVILITAVAVFAIAH